jgi:hypothetical protein
MRFWAVVLALFAVTVAVDLLLDTAVPGMMSAYGFVGCVVIIVASKWFGKAFVQRREDHYEPRGGIGRETGDG